MVVCVILACILVAWAASYGLDEDIGGISSFNFGLSVFHFGFIPVLFVAVAWRNHILGGIAMLLYSPMLLFVVWFIMLASEGHQDVSHLVLAALVFPVGSALHLVVWWKERRSKRAPS